MELNIDKTGWKSYRFDEFAQNISQRVEPKQTDLEIYVGLEHLDPDNLHIKRNGTPADVEGTKLKFYKGDVIFGKRRAYQRKAALAETDGICSAHAMVLRANTKFIDERLFPFFFHSKVFQDIAVKISVGGLSPTINWKDLAKQEFLLPPKDQQARLAELLWAADEVVEREMEVKERLEYRYSLSVESLMKQSYKKVQLKKCTTINKKLLSSKTPSDFKLKYIDIASIIAPKKIGDLSTYTFKNAPSRARRIVKRNDLVISMVRPYLKAFVQIKSDEPNLIASTGTAVVTANENISNDYIFHTLFSKDFISHCENRMNGTNYPAITSGDLGEFSIPLPNFETQKVIADELNIIDDTLAQFDNQIAISQQLKQGLINEIF